MNINEISLKLDFPKELLDAMDGKEAIIAGGSVLRRLLRAPTEGTDIDVFFYGSVGAGSLAQVALTLLNAGYTTMSSINDTRYLHSRRCMMRGDTIIDLVHAQHDSAADVFWGFDISVAQVGYFAGGPMIMSDKAALDLIRKELRVLNPNKWPTTPQRVEKYCATFGLRVVDNL